ncbi:hypothetical protein TNCV_3771101 [Trichonephila clavipes]|nr:hypothetical protein TNCV_3771101 [Trichonephila clavipes]
MMNNGSGRKFSPALFIFRPKKTTSSQSRSRTRHLEQSKLRGPSPISLVILHSATLIKNQINFLSDEAHFWLNGYVNKQNCRIWSEANPQVYVETPLHPEKLTVW